jgi:sodium pump decarboxylase gamma subunit
MILTTFLEGLTMSVFAIAVVFVLLELVTLAIEAMAKFQKPSKPEVVPSVTPPSDSIHSLEDIKDEDMLVAALTASIDYRELTKTNVRVVSIREVK